MEPNDLKKKYLGWFTTRKSILLITAVGLVILLFQINTLLSSSFRIELFGVELLEVEHLDEEAAPDESLTLEHRRRHRMPHRPHRPQQPRRPARPHDQTDAEVFVVVEEMPLLIGGLSAVHEQIRYPEIAKRAGIEGRVIVQFIVNKEGRVEDANTVRGIGGGCDEEALRVTRQLRFQPGKQRGQTVKVKMSLPITFRLE